ncbi:MAG: GTPase Era [Actinobacteria bacterium]|nr:GTPase Era [Actinomycetota bacterium]
MGEALDNAPHGFRSGFVTLIGRPNVGKSTLLNRILDRKVSIVSDTPQTTRNQIRGVYSTEGVQVVFLDTPGIHKPRTRLGERLNRRAVGTLAEVDVTCLLIEANAPIGTGDRFVAETVLATGTPAILVVNKVDVASAEEIAAHLADAVDALGEFDAFVPLSARTGDGVPELLGEVCARLPVGPRYYPEGVVTDQPEAFVAAELLREKLIAALREELPHSIAVTVSELEERDNGVLAISALVLVERQSQKGIVIGKGGEVLKRAGTQAREELEALLGTKVFLETRVRVEPDWQRRDHALDRLGY